MYNYHTKAFGNDLDLTHLQQFYFLHAEYQTTASSTYSPPVLYITVISLAASGWLHGAVL
jgi:hypothetical protein